MLRNRLPNILFAQCRHVRTIKNENYRTRLADEGRKKIEKSHEKLDKNYRLGKEVDFGKVRCNLNSLRETENAPQQFPTDPDAPVELPFNPYEKAPKKCILCALGVKLDYKNARLLQQFVSTFSGRVYDRHVTGLCDRQHDVLLRTISLSRRSGYMPSLVKEPKYRQDPKLFDPMKPLRQHSYDTE